MKMYAARMNNGKVEVQEFDAQVRGKTIKVDGNFGTLGCRRVIDRTDPRIAHTADGALEAQINLRVQAIEALYAQVRTLQAEIAMLERARQE